MKYDDDELAEAALLLAVSERAEAMDRAPAMPRALEQKILEQGRAFGASVRSSTTKAGAVAIEAPSAPGPRSSPAREWVGWLAAAACFAFAVYTWRSATAGEEPSSSGALTAPPIAQARDQAGAVVAELAPGDGAASGRVRVKRLPASVAGEHYRVWVSASDAATAAPVGAFDCPEECREATFSFGFDGLARPIGNAGAVRGIWLTRSRTGDPWKLDERSVVAEGHGDP